ncbi:MAG: YigZ family protein [Ignavibacteriota bacterium]|nr:YigZ family protein [Ignavibacteriota bacterium]
MEKDNYITISEKATVELKIQRSRFIANAYPVNTPDESSKILNVIRKEYHDAKHHPFSFVLFEKDNFRYNDDGEPSGSSGKPIYDAINKYNLKNVLVVVTRYFGGIKLGVGGLKRAYSDAADECLKICSTKEVILKEKTSLKFSYSHISAVMNYLEKNKIHISENNSSEAVILVCEVRLSDADNFKSDITEITNGTAEIY